MNKINNKTLTKADINTKVTRKTIMFPFHPINLKNALFKIVD